MKHPHYFQAEAIAAFYDYFESGKRGNVLMALATGTGKSFVIAWLIRDLLTRWPGVRVLSLVHVHTLIKQTYEELMELWPTAPAGICSAGLNRFDTSLPILFGGIQSAVKRVDQFGYRDLLIVDECHLCSPNEESQYQKVIARLRQKNPALRILGLSATIWRLGLGSLTEGGIFTDVIYDKTDLKSWNRLFAEGFLVPPIPKRTLTELDLSQVHIQGYKFNERELDAASNQHDLNIKCCEEMCAMAGDRRCWLVFCASIDHAEKINSILRRFGVDSEVVHSKKGKEHNDATIKRWKEGRLRCIVNKDMLTTGVNNPACDFIGCLRGLVSSSLWVQMLGRGTRTFPSGSKTNCLVADFAGNTRRLGPINDPVIPRKPGKGSAPGTVPIRICDACGAYNHASARVCIGCGAEFPVNSRLVGEASEAPIVREEGPKLATYEVHHVTHKVHHKGERPSLQVNYHVGNRGLQRYSEWVCLEHEGFASKKARDWWRMRAGAVEPPGSVNEAVERWLELRVPKKLTVDIGRKYPEITNMEW